VAGTARRAGGHLVVVPRRLGPLLRIRVTARAAEKGDRSGCVERGGTEDRALERAPSIRLHPCPHVSSHADMPPIPSPTSTERVCMRVTCRLRVPSWSAVAGTGASPPCHARAHPTWSPGATRRKGRGELTWGSLTAHFCGSSMDAYSESDMWLLSIHRGVATDDILGIHVGVVTGALVSCGVATHPP
jgi:hypothetical protein